MPHHIWLWSKDRLSGRQLSWRYGCFIILTALILSCLAPPAVVAEESGPLLFNSTEKRKEGLKPFPKWTGALEKYFDERKNVDGGCEAKEFNRCHFKQWQIIVDAVQGKSVKEQINAINSYMNKYEYIVDPINWGVKDYWASPGEFFDKFGDCEDYAIAKYLSLKMLGVDPNIMRIVIVMDLNLKVLHAVLGVYADDEIYILDNQLSIVVKSNIIKHYKPIFSVNESGWWKHKVKRG